jgi:hypothetical protein
MPLTCPRCHGFVGREPATIVCRLCGAWGLVLDASPDQRVAQRVLDAALRPCSAECDPMYNVPRPLGWTAGQLRLPGEPRVK